MRCCAPDVVLLALAAAGAAAAQPPACDSASSVSLTVSWPAAAGADLYDLQYALAPWDDAAPPPHYVSQTSAAPQAVVEDLLPSTQYHFRVRSRNESAVRPFGWSAFGASAACATAAPRPGAPVGLRRAGGLMPDAMGLAWTLPAGAPPAPLRVDVRTPAGPGGVAAERRTLSAPAGATSMTLAGLRPGAAHSVSVGGCDAVTFRTRRAGGARTLPVYRISTTGNDVDFLTDHNTGDIPGDEGFITYTSNSNHFYESFNMSVMTQYCIDAAAAPEPAPPDAVDGWVQYLSCDSGKAGPPIVPPKCACWNWIDRTIAHDPTINHTCGKRAPGSWMPPCNCSDASLAASFAGVGRQPVRLPWEGPPGGPGEALLGYWYSTPGAAECAEGAPVGTGGCAWARHPVARAVRGFHFAERGWLPRTGNGTTPSSQFLHNANVTAAVYAAITPRCCGC